MTECIYVTSYTVVKWINFLVSTSIVANVTNVIWKQDKKRGICMISVYSNISQILLLYQVWGYDNEFNFMKSLEHTTDMSKCHDVAV